MKDKKKCYCIEPCKQLISLSDNLLLYIASVYMSSKGFFLPLSHRNIAEKGLLITHQIMFQCVILRKNGIYTYT